MPSSCGRIAPLLVAVLLASPRPDGRGDRQGDSRSPRKPRIEAERGSGTVLGCERLSRQRPALSFFLDCPGGVAFSGLSGFSGFSLYDFWS